MLFSPKLAHLLLEAATRSLLRGLCAKMRVLEAPDVWRAKRANTDAGAGAGAAHHPAKGMPLEPARKAAEGRLEGGELLPYRARAKTRQRPS